MAHPASIDINADLGEGFANDVRLLDLVTSASVCCGAHAGDRETILDTLAAAAARGVPVGAHPGFADREGFGRVEHDASTGQVAALVRDQVAFLAELASGLGLSLRFVKPHGALYNQAQRSQTIARGVVDAVRAVGLPVLGQHGGELERLARQAEIPFIAEGFPERRYRADGRLIPRSEAGAVLHDPVEIGEQVVRLARQGVATLCIHGDDPDALAKAENVRGVLGRHGIAPRFWG